MSDFEDNYAEFIGDFSLKFNKSQKKKLRKKIAPAENNKDAVEKFLETETSISIDDILAKLIKDRIIKEGAQVVKNTDSYVLLYAKLDPMVWLIKPFIFEADGVVKIFKNFNYNPYELYAYSRKLKHETKNVPKSTKKAQYKIETDPNFICDSLTLHTDRNVTVMFKKDIYNKYVTLHQLIKTYPSNLLNYFGEIFQLICEIKERDPRFWRWPENVMKKIVFNNRKFLLISSIDPLYDCDDCVDSEDFFQDNVASLLENFNRLGIRRDQLDKTFYRICKSLYSGEWNHKTNDFINFRSFPD